MTVTSTATQTVLTANGVTTAWPFTFIIPDETSLFVYVTDLVGNVTLLNANAYSATGFSDPDGGTVTYPLTGAPLPAGYHVTIQRIVPFLQLDEINNYDESYASVIQDALDRIVMMVQQQIGMTIPVVTIGGISVSQIKQELSFRGVFDTIYELVPGSPANTVNQGWNSGVTQPNGPLMNFIAATLGYSGSDVIAFLSHAATFSF